MMEEFFPTYIKRLIITNHKCFYKPTTFDFEPGFNILIGENSSGKSTVLEALDPSTKPHLHRSQLNETEPRIRKNEAISIETRTALSIDAVASLSESKLICVGNHDEQTGNVQRWDEHSVQRQLSDSPYLHFDFRRVQLLPAGPSDSVRLGFPGRENSWFALGSARAANGCVAFEHSPFAFHHYNQIGNQNTLWRSIRDKLALRTYRFVTERRILPRCSSQPINTELAPDGSNLAFCLNDLQTSSGTLFRDLVSYVKYIFPAIKSVNARPDNSEFVIKISHIDDEHNRPDLAVGLDQVGTGVGNIIAMLYAAITARTPKTFLLEEPNSYLHPTALRELLAILAETEIKHQYFISTHSSEVLRAVKSATVTHLEYDGQESTQKQVPGHRLSDLRAGLMDMGIRMTDLHGCDFVIWVEGQTEEAVFPLLLRKRFGEQASRIAVLRVHATSDFDDDSPKKFDPVKVAEIYRKLSDGNALAPIMAGIVLDREGRQKAECERIEKEADGKIHFLAKPMLEDYLLDPDAISELIHTRIGTKVDTASIQTELENGKALPSCWINPKSKAAKPPFHAARLLHHVLQAVTGNTLEYSKTRDAPELVEFLIRFRPDALKELDGLLRTVLQQRG